MKKKNALETFNAD